jgi:anthranilate phosphoribosyltransferase
MRPILAQTLATLGTRRAWVVSSEDGLDEVSPFASTRITQVSDGRLTERVVSAEDFGFDTPSKDSIEGGDAKYNASVLLRVLDGDEHPSRTAFLLNAAAALAVFFELEPKEAASRATEALVSGAARGALEKLRTSSKAATIAKA